MMKMKKNIIKIRVKNNSNLGESRNSSLVIISTSDQNKSLSKSRPKQRHPKLIDDNEKVSSILKMLEKNHKIEFSNKNSTKENKPKIASSSEEIDPKTERSKMKTDKSTLRIIESMQTPMVNKGKISIDKPHNLQSLNKRESNNGREKINVSLIPEKLNILENKEIIDLKHSMIKGAKKELKKLNYIYSSSKHKYPAIRANSQLESAKKSVSIVSLSPSENMNNKDIILYNPYTKSLNKNKIHLPYLRKQKKPMPQMRDDNNLSKRRNDRITNNISLDFPSNNNHENRSFDLMKEINIMKKKRPRPKIEDFQFDYAPVAMQK